MREAYKQGNTKLVKKIGMQELKTPAEFKEAWKRIQ